MADPEHVAPRGEATPSALLDFINSAILAVQRDGKPWFSSAEIAVARSEVSALLAEAQAARAAQTRYETLRALLREAQGSASPAARFICLDTRRIDRAIAESLAAAGRAEETT